MDIYKAFLNSAKKQPDKIALIHKDKKVKFSQAAKDVNRLAYAFKEMGMKKGEKLAVFLPNSIEYVYTYLSALGLGITVVPIDISFKPEELENILSHAEVSYLVAEKALKFNFPYFKRTIADIHKLIDASEEKPIDVPIDEEDRAIIFYTSGTTGRPKAVPLTYRHFNSPLGSIKYALKDYEIYNVLACYVPLSHSGGFIYPLLLANVGSSLVLGERFSPIRFLKDIETYKVTISWVPPSILEAVLRSKGIDTLSLKSLKCIVYFGAPASPGLLKEFEERFPHVNAITGWGPTESAPPNVVLSPDDPKEKRFKRGIMGKVPPWIKTKIVDDKGNSLPNGQTGEILLKGYFVMPGYYKEPELTEEVIKDGWLYTGDLGYLDEEGYLYIVGRKKDVIITGGLNVYPNDVEFVISEHPKVAEVAVVGVPDELRGEVVKAVIVPKEKLKKEEIIFYCRKRLANYKVPKIIEFRKSLPKTALGKIKKAELINECIEENPQEV